MMATSSQRGQVRAPAGGCLLAAGARRGSEGRSLKVSEPLLHQRVLGWELQPTQAMARERS